MLTNSYIGLLHSHCKAMKRSSAFMQMLKAEFSLAICLQLQSLEFFSVFMTIIVIIYNRVWLHGLRSSMSRQSFALNLKLITCRSQGLISITVLMETLETDRKGWIILITLQSLGQSPKKFLSTSWEFSLHFDIEIPIGFDLPFLPDGPSQTSNGNVDEC